MAQNSLATLRETIDVDTYASEQAICQGLVALADLSGKQRAEISQRATALVEAIRKLSHPSLMEVFLAEYGLSTEEGVALMCLAEALLRVPDTDTIDALIEDKIAPSDWSKHLGSSASPLVNTATWGLMLTGRVLKDNEMSPAKVLRSAVKRLGEPVIRTAVSAAMREMGRQFVLGETINRALKRARQQESRGFTYSYDMLGEAAHTEHDAKRYFHAYSDAIAAIALRCSGTQWFENPGISIKLSALHPRYEVAQRERVMTELVPRVLALAKQAAHANMGFNIDAEEQDRLALSLDVISAVLEDPSLEKWQGFGVVVQAYGLRAEPTIDYLYQLAQSLGRRIAIRLVKGAYWDTEIKRAQVAGLNAFPVFTHKAATDISYIANARTLLSMRDVIYPQFATHNAHSVAAIEYLAKGSQGFEYQRLHGMGDSLYTHLLDNQGVSCRIYAPVGAHQDLLAYLVRRLLENGANSSFVNQIVNSSISAREVAADPFERYRPTFSVPKGSELFLPERVNSGGFDLSHTPTLASIDRDRNQFRQNQWTAISLTSTTIEMEQAIAIFNPACSTDCVGSYKPLTEKSIEGVVNAAQQWGCSAAARADILNRVADRYERTSGELCALLAREAGKTLPDCVAEIREAVDFLRYYASKALSTSTHREPLGKIVCISPWNFPLAIFTGQIAAALAMGNAVIAKPAEQTPLIATIGTKLFHESGVPISALQLVLGDGTIGAALTRNGDLQGLVFTGSTQTAVTINKALASYCKPGTPLIAETGGLNAMIIDSTALLEQAVTAVIESAFQSAGQRCSALRCLYIQEDIYESFIALLTGAMDELTLGDPWLLSTDCGPVIDAQAKTKLDIYLSKAKNEGRLIHTLQSLSDGYFVAPTLIEVKSIEDLKEEVFGPVLHIARYTANNIDKVIEAINRTGFGLTAGLQTRIDDRIQYVKEKLKVGNLYVNRNQVGAIVGSQPFGGEGLSGTGPKAGGSFYLSRLSRAASGVNTEQALSPDSIDARPLSTYTMAGPTGESNTLTLVPKSPVLCLGPGEDKVREQVSQVEALGGTARSCTGDVSASDLKTLTPISSVVWWGDIATGRLYARALADREGPIVPLVTDQLTLTMVMHERHLCVDTTAAGGNAALLNQFSNEDTKKSAVS